jgi:hypothetical protein
LVFDSKHFRIGKIVTFVSLLAAIAAAVVPVVRRRRAQ